MATNIMNNTQFRSIVAPILNEAFDGLYEQRKDEWKQIFKEVTGIARNRHEDVVMYGFGAAPELGEGAPVTYAQGGQSYIKNYIYKRYGYAFALTSTLVEDGNHISLGTTYSKHLAQSLIETKENLCANVLNTGFTSNGADGTPLIGTSHPISTGAYSNQLATAAALSQTSVEQMLITIRTNGVDDSGKRINLSPTKLVVSPQNEFQANIIVNSANRSGTANNDINPIKTTKLLSEGVAVLTRLSSPTAWWIYNDGVMEGLKVVMRSPLKKSMEGDFETDSMRYKAIERYDVGYTDARVLFGTVGA